MQLVLASSSPYRRELLARLRLEFSVAAPDIDETPLPGEDPAATSLRLAAGKAQALAAQHPDTLIIGSDQVALLDGQQIGKPGTHERAVAQLRQMRGRTLRFHTALCLLNTRTGRVQQDIDVTEVRMRDYDDATIEAYLRAEPAYNCAGSVKSEGYGITLIAAMQTSDPSALVGLPLIKLVSLLQAEGVRLP